MFSACGGIRTGGKLLPVLTAYFPRAGSGDLREGWIVRCTTPRRRLFYPSWNRLYRFIAFWKQCCGLPSTDLTLKIRQLCWNCKPLQRDFFVFVKLIEKKSEGFITKLSLATENVCVCSYKKTELPGFAKNTTLPQKKYGFWPIREWLAKARLSPRKGSERRRKLNKMNRTNKQAYS